MKSLLITCFTTLLITLAGPASADSNSGTITFSGAIINGSCNMNIGQNPVVCLTALIPPGAGLLLLLLT